MKIFFFSFPATCAIISSICLFLQGDVLEVKVFQFEMPSAHQRLYTEAVQLLKTKFLVRVVSDQEKVDDLLKVDGRLAVSLRIFLSHDPILRFIEDEEIEPVNVVTSQITKQTSNVR